MRRISISILCILVFLGASSVQLAAEGGENCTISGDVNFQYDGDIYICLLTKEELGEFVLGNHELSPSECKVIRMNANLKRAGKVSFKFESIPKGTYCIVTYQDANKNGKVNYENLMLSKLWGSYKESVHSSMIIWDDVKFDLEKDITGIKIQGSSRPCFFIAISRSGFSWLWGFD
jgi:uncharacterized protein (DUF2141 family)